jgi:hypothetical protein
MTKHITPLGVSEHRAANAAKFMAVYEKMLRAALELFPDEFLITSSDVPRELERTHTQIELGFYSTDERAMAGTCNVLGIRCTRISVEKYLEDGAPPHNYYDPLSLKPPPKKRKPVPVDYSRRSIFTLGESMKEDITEG